MEHKDISLVWNVNLDKLLVSQVLINGILQRVQYEYIPTICFACGLYEHVKEICSNMEPCLRENGGVPPASGESLMVDAEKGNREGSEDFLKANIKGKGSQMGIGLVVIAGGKVSAGRNRRKLNKTKRDQESHFKMSSSSRVPLSKLVNNMVEHISSQIGKQGDTGGLKVVGKQLEVEDGVRVQNFPIFSGNANGGLLSCGPDSFFTLVTGQRKSTIRLEKLESSKEISHLIISSRATRVGIDTYTLGIDTYTLGIDT
ncbi:hypothetical protein Gogos_020370 [Gossypium gossypioides]|uniref:Zinc knuckle CX2CX4HX4C domain-containing protein n=1 Tax=Gossypium gossypioides TaxID=34282 RepID=A0A7J9CYE4_GOSGO|nr:hypothetical protein [Gossypium gossypioides]